MHVLGVLSVFKNLNKDQEQTTKTYIQKKEILNTEERDSKEQ